MPKCKKCKKECLESELTDGICIYCKNSQNEQYNKQYDDKIYKFSNSIMIIFSVILILSILFFIRLCTFVNFDDNSWDVLGIVIRFYCLIPFWISLILLIFATKNIRRYLLGENKNGIKTGKTYAIIALIMNIILLLCLSPIGFSGSDLIWIICLDILFIILPTIFYMHILRSNTHK